ncbi:MAG: DUF3999 family protein [Terracidiphilus sp.]|nr:DUF3999 family protein [Terracidiphilus sp.]MDR3776587.1 DUF3999 family protein [Terracidiphilus sp.]
MPQASGQTCLVLDAEIFAHAAPQLADLRLYRDGVETPYIVRVDTQVAAVEKSIVPLNVGVRGGQTVFDAEIPDAHYTDLQLAVASQNFIATVTVSGSRARTGSAETRLGSYTIFDLTRQKLGRSTVLHLPESDFRYLHFSITRPVSPENITGLSVERMAATQSRYGVAAESSLVMQKGHDSVLEFTVPAHVPVDRIAFTPSAAPALFSRDVSISVTPVTASSATQDNPSSQTVTSTGNILRVHSVQNGQRIDEEHLAINAPAADFSTPAKWTVTIDNGDDAPLKLESVRLQMVQRTLCFEAAAKTRYTLFYGDPAVQAPHYDYATLFTLQADALPAASGPEQPNPTYQSRPDARPFTEKHPALLWVALIAVIALLAGIAVRSAKPPAQPLS